MLPAIILAAGRGARLGALTEKCPKCLLRVGEASLLAHQLDALQSFGVDAVTVVAGYGAEAVETELGGRARCVRNERHEVTNSLYSLWLTRSAAREGFLLLNGDVLFDREILGAVLASPFGDVFAVERRAAFNAEEMKVELASDRILALSKSLPGARSHAENVGILKVSGAGARVLFRKMKELLAAGAETELSPYAFNALAADYPLHAVPIDGLPWVEVDFVEDLRRAHEEVWPAILARRAPQTETTIARTLPAGRPPAVLYTGPESD